MKTTSPAAERYRIKKDTRHNNLSEDINSKASPAGEIKRQHNHRQARQKKVHQPATKWLPGSSEHPHSRYAVMAMYGGRGCEASL